LTCGDGVRSDKSAGPIGETRQCRGCEKKVWPIGPSGEKECAYWENEELWKKIGLIKIRGVY